MNNRFTQIILILTTVLLTSCGKNIMNTDYFSKEEASVSGSKNIQGYWKSNAFEIDHNGEIDQNIYLEDIIALEKSNPVTFNQALESHQCAEVKELDSVKSIRVELQLFVQYEEYYMIADVTYTALDDQKYRCPGVLGQGEYTEDKEDYLFLKDIDLSLHILKQNDGKIAIKFLR